MVVKRLKLLLGEVILMIIEQYRPREVQLIGKSLIKEHIDPVAVVHRPLISVELQKQKFDLY